MDAAKENPGVASGAKLTKKVCYQHSSLHFLAKSPVLRVQWEVGDHVNVSFKMIFGFTYHHPC